jgi:hypothetical protein
MSKNWKPYNVKAICNSIEKCLKECSMDHFTKQAYDFVYLLSGFIAHYNHQGFCDQYNDNMTQFVEDLKNSHSVMNPEHYMQSCFVNDYGWDYCVSERDICVRIGELVKQYDESVEATQARKDYNEEVRNAMTIAKKYNLTISPEKAVANGQCINNA